MSEIDIIEEQVKLRISPVLQIVNAIVILLAVFCFLQCYPAGVMLFIGPVIFFLVPIGVALSKKIALQIALPLSLVSIIQILFTFLDKRLMTTALSPYIVVLVSSLFVNILYSYLLIIDIRKFNNAKQMRTGAAIFRAAKNT